MRLLESDLFPADLKADILRIAQREPFAGNELAQGLVSEIVDRLDQLSILREIIETEERCVFAQANARRSAGTVPIDSDLSADAFESAEKAVMLAEAFYLFAFRAYDIMRWLNKKAFGESNICAAPKGITALRNRLLIHPEREPKPVLSRNFSISREHGVRLKTNRPPYESDDPADVGFKVNSVQFRTFVAAWVAEMKRRLT